MYNYEHMKNEYRSMLDPLKEGFFSSELTCMPITVGDQYKESPIRLMYVGRAVNGWNNVWQKGTTEQLVEQVFERTQDMSVIMQGIVKYQKNGEDCEYNYNRSPFWQLCRKLLSQYEIRENWANHVAWTNLFKVSYSEAGNPNVKLIKQTIDSCSKILFYEVFCEMPTHIVFVTDEWWIRPEINGVSRTAFLDSLGIEICNNSNDGIIVGSGVLRNEYFDFPASPRPKYVITRRPETAKMSRAEHAAAIKRAFETIEG